jgi:hypothetical protein
MQNKYYTILPTADLAVITAWADEPDHRCYVIAQGRVDSVTHSLCVHQPPGMSGVFELTESALAGMIAEAAWPG